MSDSTPKQTRKKTAKNERPRKPYADFPLYPHPLGYWSKKIRGKIHHFGRWGRVKKGKLKPVEGENWKEAMDLYNLRKTISMPDGRLGPSKMGV